ncbi:hypothetical protein IMCC26134_00660 [Verrucomicrobia bacterium IMCC26134]|nr:hypothetical protein IMCC26134_00660 [Verrucomicrobia bacterium IMCC26134]
MKPSHEKVGEVLAVDLDGTLLRGDLFWEGLTRFLFPRFWRIIPALGWLVKGGRPFLKSRVAAATALSGERLMWNEEVLHFCKTWRDGGGRVVLASAADREAAQKVTRHLPFISEVFGSEAGDNLKGARKAKRLVAEFGAEGFDYIGDCAADLPVWRSARNAWFVGTESRRATLAARLGKPLAAVAPSPACAGALALKALRPHQWLKNLLVFFPLCAAHRWSDWNCWQQTMPVFLAVCCLASSSYLLNDLADLDADRAHPRKRGRPFASGAWSIPAGLVTAMILFLTGMALATFSSPAALPVIAGYYALSLFYTLVVKTAPVFDGIFLSGLYTYRMLLGGVAGMVWISPWLLAFSTTFFLGLAFLKRYIELSYLPEDGDDALARRGYSRSDLGFVLTVGIASGFLSVVVLALYLDSSASKALYASPHWLWLIALILMLWIMRVWFLAGRKTMHDDPVWFAARDWVTWALALLCVLAATAAKPI